MVSDEEFSETFLEQLDCVILFNFCSFEAWEGRKEHVCW